MLGFKTKAEGPFNTQSTKIEMGGGSRRKGKGMIFNENKSQKDQREVIISK